jgi:hypothetical protein
VSPAIIPHDQRAEEARQAYRMYTTGVPKTEIAQTLGRNRRTVDKLLEEAAAWYEGDTTEFKRRYLVSAHREVLRLALEGAEELPAKSPSRGQHLMAANEALKAIARIEGLLIHRVESKTVSLTIADLVKESERRRKVVDSEPLDELEAVFRLEEAQ